MRGIDCKVLPCECMRILADASHRKIVPVVLLHYVYFVRSLRIMCEERPSFFSP